MVAALTRIFGVHNLALAEDVVQDAFCRALEVWKFRGIPENPSGWLMATAKNRALDVIRRERTARNFAPELGRLLDSEWTLVSTIEDLFSPKVIEDDLLRMMFSCCHPRLAEEAQIALILNVLCGFSVDEIASAFLNTHAAVEKRITRAKKGLAASKKLFDVSAPADFSARLPAVHRALYLLFNEGYHGASAESPVRHELYLEAMRLMAILLKHPQGKTPATYALAALMYFHAARVPGRIDASGNLSSLYDQDRSQWDQKLLVEGFQFMELSATGPRFTEYHIEAAIAAAHACAVQIKETDWKTIVALYDALMTIKPTPVVALNRAIAVSQTDGPQVGLRELSAIIDCDRLNSYPFYFAAMGELELQSGRREAAREHFRAALALARNKPEHQFFQGRVSACV
jgi:RNA polymerase sigma-70 factor (ECF subfamily)